MRLRHFLWGFLVGCILTAALGYAAMEPMGWVLRYKKAAPTRHMKPKPPLYYDIGMESDGR